MILELNEFSLITFNQPNNHMFCPTLNIGLVVEDESISTHMKFYCEQIVSIKQIYVQSRFISSGYQMKA